MSDIVTYVTQRHPEENNNWWLVAHIYSMYQISLVAILLLFPTLLPDWFKDYIRAATILVAVSWILLYVYVGPNKIEEFYRLRFPWIDKKMIYILDILIHFVPVLLVGIPTRTFSFIYAFGIILLWYIVFRPFVQNAYSMVPLKVIDIAFFAFGPFIVLILVTLHLASKKWVHI